MIDLFQRNFDSEPLTEAKASPQDKMSDIGSFCRAGIAHQGSPPRGL